MESIQKYSTLFPDYEFLKLVGQGSYGDVFYCIRKSDGVKVALKIIRNSDSKDDGLSVTTLREIKFLRYCDHPNIVRVLDIISPDISWDTQYDKIPPLALVMEYVEYDLLGLLKSARMKYSKSLSVDAVRYIAFQLFSALAYLHNHNIIHRDLKSANILISSNCEVKLGDFGLSRCIGNIMISEFTNRVITLWYRPPELILGSTHYGPEVDIWSAGCILAELLSGDTLFPNYNNSEISQLQLIFQKCGFPDDPLLLELLDKNHFRFNGTFTRTLPQCVANTSSSASYHLPPDAFDLLDRILQTSPAKRPSANQILQHPFFHGMDNIEFSFPQMKEEGCHDLDVFRKMSNNAEQGTVGNIIISRRMKDRIVSEEVIDLCSDDTLSEENTIPQQTELPVKPSTPSSSPSSTESTMVAVIKPMNRKVALSPTYPTRSSRRRKRTRPLPVETPQTKLPQTKLSKSKSQRKKLPKGKLPKEQPPSENPPIENPPREKKPRNTREQDREKWDAILLEEERKAEEKKLKREVAYQSRLKAKEEMELQKQIRLFQIMEGNVPPETPGRRRKKVEAKSSTTLTKKPSEANSVVTENTK